MKSYKPFLKSAVLAIGLAAGFTTVIGQLPEPSPTSLSNIDRRFYSKLAEAASRTDFENTKRSGGRGGDSFVEVRPEGAYLVGFEAWQGDWFGHRIVRGIRPIFQTATGRIRGERHGSTGGTPTMTVEAKEGYAVAAIEPRGGQRLDGFQVLYWKVRPSMARLDADGAYKSEWVGGGGGGKTKHPLTSDGRPVLGISGASGADMDRIGLIYADPAALSLSVPQPTPMPTLAVHSSVSIPLAQISEALLANTWALDAPKFHFKQRRKFNRDGSWTSLTDAFRGGWKIQADKLLVTLSTKPNSPETYTLPPKIFEPAAKRIHLDGIGLNGDPVTLDIADQSRPAVGQPTPGNSYFGNFRP